MDIILGGANDKNFGIVCEFEFPFDAVTLTSNSLPSPAGKVQIIFVEVHDVGAHNSLPMYTVFVVVPV